MMTYWREYSKEASVKEMLLDFDAEELSKEEIPEIMSMVPDTAGMDVLELAAGIGWVLFLPSPRFHFYYAATPTEWRACVMCIQGAPEKVVPTISCRQLINGLNYR